MNYLVETQESVSIQFFKQLKNITKKELTPTMCNNTIYLFGETMPEWYISAKYVNATENDFQTFKLNPYTRRRRCSNIKKEQTIDNICRWNWTEVALFMCLKREKMYYALKTLLYCADNQ